MLKSVRVVVDRQAGRFEEEEEEEERKKKRECFVSFYAQEKTRIQIIERSSHHRSQSHNN
jgi:hypothetical protein